MDSRRLVPILAALVGLALVLAGCDDTGYSYDGPAYVTPTQRLPSALELAARETAIAQETREAMENEAKGTAEALSNQRQATQQVLDLNATRQAQEVNATRQAWEFARTQEAAAIQATATAQAANVQATSTAEARQATATRQSIEATATAAGDQATATAGQAIANLQQTQVAATAQAVNRANEREAVTQPLRAWWLWVLLALAIPALVYLGWRAAQVIEARSRVIRRKADEGEPVIMLTRDRMALPLRSFNALMSGEEMPALPAPEHQEAATMRQQAANALQARQVAQTVKARKAHKAKPSQVVAQRLQALPQRKTRRAVPGLVKVVSVKDLADAAQQGILPPRLAESIEGEWSEVDRED